ncbi:hypothetical protein TWF730_004563 [Orbilia blumenaviensis]|uniref:Uncharacterized protein n=1 Tax=Orbilia blumenaviensis TaxID=1796055 RepID=A0AAV9U219_9PEZI
MSMILVVSLAGLISAAFATTCEPDNCLRAIRASSRLSDASAACSSYLRTTFTPDTRTYTYYDTVSELAQETQYSTQTNTFFDTLTTVIKQTVTIQEAPYTSTVTIFDPALKKRQVAPTIPAYASPCSGEARFTSACSCIGVTGPITVTAPVPSTTITLTTTVTYSTGTNVVTVETKSVTVTDATEFITTIDSTKTLPGPPATVTITVPYPPHCKNIVWRNGIRYPDDGWRSENLGPISPQDCCLRCFLTLNCITHV